MKRQRADIFSANAFRRTLLVTVAGPVCISVIDGAFRGALAADRDHLLDLTVTAQAPPPPPSLPGAADQPAEEITITAKRLEAARLGIQPQIGASSYTITRQSLETQPGGENTIGS